ncbi:MAG TPA: hypothetical protein VL443_01490 [Cyclobacteriaceae bacterium]|nr:hypothetical protein [Cyclobacteriaceae bacterium]
MNTIALKNWGMNNEVGKKNLEQLSSLENRKRVIIFSILGAVTIALAFVLAFYSLFIRELEAIVN